MAIYHEGVNVTELASLVAGILEGRKVARAPTYRPVGPGRPDGLPTERRYESGKVLAILASLRDDNSSIFSDSQYFGTTRLYGVMHHIRDQQEIIDAQKEKINRLEATVADLKRVIDAKDSEIDGRKEEIEFLKETLQRLKDRFVFPTPEPISPESGTSPMWSVLPKAARVRNMPWRFPHNAGPEPDVTFKSHVEFPEGHRHRFHTLSMIGVFVPESIALAAVEFLHPSKVDEWKRDVAGVYRLLGPGSSEIIMTPHREKIARVILKAATMMGIKLDDAALFAADQMEQVRRSKEYVWATDAKVWLDTPMPGDRGSFSIGEAAKLLREAAELLGVKLP